MYVSVKEEKKKILYLAFLDVSNAYDSALREGLWCKMRHGEEIF